MSEFPTVPSDIDREAVLARCRYFTAVGLWPLPVQRLDPEAWLENFLPDEERYAIYLLNAFLYFDEMVIDRIFVAACHDISNTLGLSRAEPEASRREWHRYLDEVTVTAVRGERPAATDSGALFTRRARGLLGIDKARILEQAAAVSHVAQNGGDILFVDDFVGTGNQFVDTFKREFAVEGHGRTSFAALAGRGIGRYVYCPIVATEAGRKRIKLEFPAVRVVAGHVLPARYSALHPDSFIWPDDLRAGAVEFIRRASQRAGIPDDPGTVSGWRGFGSLGLVLAFAHGSPDATLPLIWWDTPAWRPLRGRG